MGGRVGERAGTAAEIKSLAAPLPSPESILVYVGGDLIGDGLMNLPFVRAQRHAYPDAHITWMAGKEKTVYADQLAALVRGLIDEVIEEAGFDNPWPKLLRRQRRIQTQGIRRRDDRCERISSAHLWHL